MRLFLGAGGTGGYFGGRAAQAGADVTFLVRERARPARRRVAHPQPAGRRRGAAKLATSQTLDGAYDVVVLSCKAYDRPAPSRRSARRGAGHGGAAHHERRAAIRGAGPRVRGAARVGRAVPDQRHPGAGRRGRAPGKVRQHRVRRTRRRHAAPAARRWRRPWLAATSSRLSDNIHQDVWEKYVFLTTLAAGTCLMRGPVGRIAATDDGADILRALLRESQAVAAASGHGAARGRRLGAEDPDRHQPAHDRVHVPRPEPGLAGRSRPHRRRHGAPRRHVGVDATYLRVAYAHLQVYQAQRAAG